jgi:hypothetical protein
MEKTKMNYQNGKIYTIRSFQTDDVYYGSTTQPLSKRLNSHNSKYKKWKNNQYHYITSFEVLKFDDCYIELYELYPCNSRTELERREGQVIRENNNSVNKHIAGRTKKEWIEANIDHMKQYKKQYRLDNTDKLKQREQKYREANCEKIKSNQKQYREVNMDKLKQYRIDNAPKNKIKQKQYYEANKDNINEKHCCICGGSYSNRHKAEHLKTRKHLTYLESIAHNIDTP